MLIEESAVKKLSELKEPGFPYFRIYVDGGGCSGFQYGFQFVEQTYDDDKLFEFDNITIIVDTMSYAFLGESTVAWEEDIMGAQLKINNPGVASTCGCGASFCPK